MITTGIVEQTKELLHAVRGSLVHVAQNLHVIKTSGEWQNHASSWGEFCEDTLQVSQSQASKLLAIHQYFVIECGKSVDDLAGIDYEKLYAVKSLTGSVEDQLTKARTLSRRDLKEEKNDEEPHEHVPIEICKVCSIRL